MKLVNRALACLLIFSPLAIATAHAQSSDAYPSRPVRLIVTVPPGGAADFIARLIGAKLAEALGQPLLVENRAGASGTIAADAVAKAAPDGYTLLQNSITTHGIGPHLYARLPYDSIRDFAPITMLARLPLIMTINGGVKANTVQELVALAKAQPDRFSFASSGNGGAPHMAGELFKSATGADLLHVPYKGSGPAVADLISGQVQVMFDGAPSLIQHVRTGKLRAIGAASAQRNRLLPEVPTFAEAGYPGVDVALWYGLLAPAGTPPAIIARLNAKTVKALNAPDVRERFAAQGTEAMGGTPEQAAAFIRGEIDRWGPVVKKAGVKAD
ncbi:MAG: tripartite tricarboxylate transporter substrate binding protein [Betaproteobacteria bacterium]|nr:tripartite tricarboxylate transporter substrate binding protein [Betaproteobacteria bacterium]